MSTKIKNYNNLELKNFDLTINRIPEVMFKCTSAPLPGITASAIKMATPFTKMAVHGDAGLIWQPLIVTFLVDEDLNNWEELFNWITGYSTPESFDEYKRTGDPSRGYYDSKKSDGTLIATNNKYNKNVEFIFKDLHPIDITDIIFDHQIDGVDVAIATSTFEYTNYTLKR